MKKLIKFYADWCGPCKALSAHIDKLDLSVEVESVNYEEHPEKAQEYGIRALPSIVGIPEEGDNLVAAGLGPCKELVDSLAS